MEAEKNIRRRGGGKTRLALSDHYAIVGMLGVIKLTNHNGCGIILYTPMFFEELHFTCDSTVQLQIGGCTNDAILPDVITSGTKRNEFKNYDPVIGENTIYLGNFGLTHRLYIGRVFFSYDEEESDDVCCTITDVYVK